MLQGERLLRPAFQINFLGMFRPSQAEVDALEDLGAEGWNWDSMLHYMKKVTYYHRWRVII